MDDKSEKRIRVNTGDGPPVKRSATEIVVAVVPPAIAATAYIGGKLIDRLPPPQPKPPPDEK